MGLIIDKQSYKKACDSVRSIVTEYNYDRMFFSFMQLARTAYYKTKLINYFFDFCEKRKYPFTIEMKTYAKAYFEKVRTKNAQVTLTKEEQKKLKEEQKKKRDVVNAFRRSMNRASDTSAVFTNPFSDIYHATDKHLKVIKGKKKSR